MHVTRSLPIALLLVAAGVAPAFAQTELRAQSEDGESVSLPLVRESYRIDIDQQYATAVLRHVYRNSSEQRLEGRFLLRAGDGARVQGYSYWNGETRIVGEVFEKDTARQIYEDVTGLGRDPGLLEQVGEGAFSFRVFPIEPAELKKLEITYGVYLVRRGDVVELRAPVAAPDAEDVIVEIKDDRRIAKVRSSTHTLKTTRVDDGHVRVTAVRDGDASELVLSYTLDDEPWSVQARVHRDGDHDGYLVMSLPTPKVKRGAVTPKDVTIVLDRSGSMGGEPIAQARIAAANIVGRMSAKDHVNIILFDDGVDMLYDHPKALTDEVRAEVIAYIERVRDEGGTDLARALESALAAQVDDARPDVVLFLTDGQSDSQAALKAAAADEGDVRVYTIGVGSGVEKPLLSRLASEKRGRFTYIESPDALDAQMGNLYGQIAEPILVDVTIDVQGARMFRAYPRTMPDLYRDDELRVAARLRPDGKGDREATVIVRGMLEGKRVEFQKTIALGAQQNPWAGRVWAQARVEDLLEEIALHGETEELTTEVTELAVAYNFATPYTSFLAIPEDELTDTAADTLAAARARKQQILAAHKDAAALSRSAMPPGDPVLSVRAPSDAAQVTAYFPFGLVKDLRYDGNTEHWTVRFLVPKGVADGDYDVKVVIVHADGAVEVATIPYTIDSAGAAFDFETEMTDEGLRVTVVAAEESRLVTVALVGSSKVRADLTDTGDGRTFTGTLVVPAGRHQLRIVVADLARNESDQTFDLEIGR
jgi:Ca-activated chloride channel family protein